MNKLDSSPPSLTFPLASHADLRPVRRLIVLVPESEAEPANAARKIWELANALGSRVQFLGLCKDATYEPSLRRQIVTLSAIVGDGNTVPVESKIEFGSNWLTAVKSHWQAGDVILCFAEQRAGLIRKPLSQILESSLNATVYVLSGLNTQNRPRPTWLSQVAVWTGSLGIIAGSALLQIRITSMPRDWAQTTLLILSIVVEAWLIWVWNSIF